MLKCRDAFAPTQAPLRTGARQRHVLTCQGKSAGQGHDLQGKGESLTGTAGGWWVRADLTVQRSRANAQSETTWCGTELVYAAVQQAKH